MSSGRPAPEPPAVLDLQFLSVATLVTAISLVDAHFQPDSHTHTHTHTLGAKVTCGINELSGTIHRVVDEVCVCVCVCV